MKRTEEQIKTFFKRKTSQRGFCRELYKTPNCLIERIVDSLLEERPELKKKIWIDPCAGDGRWGKIIRAKGIACVDMDLKPLNENVKEQDFLKFDGNEYENLFFIGNPPFSLVSKFVEKALTISDTCYFLGGSAIITGKLSDRVSLLHRFYGCEGNQKDLRSKATFIDTNDRNVFIWCCGALFDKNKNKYFNRKTFKTENSFRVSVNTYCEIDNRVISLEGKC